MYISHETGEQTHKRLLKVIANSTFKLYDMSYVFEEFPLEEFPAKIRSDALALIRDDEIWSQLVPSTDAKMELFTLFRFHFKPNLDNSGFVGWLANHLKNKVGTGVFVTCGQNSHSGGIYDYWGCPLEVSDKVIHEIERLIIEGKKI